MDSIKKTKDIIEMLFDVTDRVHKTRIPTTIGCIVDMSRLNVKFVEGGTTMQEVSMLGLAETLKEWQERITLIHAFMLFMDRIDDPNASSVMLITPHEMAGN